MFVEPILSDTKVILSDTENFDNLVKAIRFASWNFSPRLLLITDKNVSLVEDIEDKVKKIFQTTVFSDIKPNPNVEMVDKVAKILLKEKIDIIWVIGGGSFMDTAKAASVISANRGSLEDYLGSSPVRGVAKGGIPIIASPTTAGTGAEVTRFGVYTSNSGRKYTLVSNFLQPKVALLIPELTYTLPPSQTAATAFDALTHALETLWNKNAKNLTDQLAISVSVEILTVMKKAFQSSINNSTKGRKEMIVAATKAGIAFNLTGTAAIHSLSFPLSEKWHVPHGVACAFFFEDVWMKNINNNQVKNKLLTVSKKLGLEGNSLDKLFDYIMDIKKEMRLPSKFSELSIKYDEQEDLKLFLDILNDPKIKNNLYPFTEKTIKDILENK